MELLKKDFKKLLYLFFCIASTVTLSAESFSVNKNHMAAIEIVPDKEINKEIGIEDSLSIIIPKNQKYKEYIEGIELKFSIPEEVAYNTDSVACSIYTDITPAPNNIQNNYKGSRIFVRTLPNKLSWVLQIPLKNENSIKSNNYTQKLNKVLAQKEDIIFIRLHTIAKNIPPEELNAVIPITIKPIFANKGKLSLELTPPKDALMPCSVFVDDEIISYPYEDEFFLPAGVHDISVISEYYRNELRTVRIDQAKETNLVVEMRSIEPTLIISAPEGTEVSVDDRNFHKFNEEVEITEGEHKIRFAIGNYEMIRNINAIKGKTYKAVFSLDLQITEE